ncbi:hypothetical protein RJ639_032280 [Escallonia herrerae]|uniref:Filament-like plant protein n=1 Tax=Escallonia herrerae TaxID=1293975 RepID=A0AA88WV79_9ASTE|nr:hypothetical protein RJ639_032280 [Escallonia herrerae]
MDKRSWLWKRKSSDRSPGDTESSGSISSHSEKYSDEQIAAIVNLRQSYDLYVSVNQDSLNHSTRSPEVTSKVAVTTEEVNDRVKSLTEKLSAALVNIGAKEDLVKQHAKVAEEAVAGWERAENEVAVLKQQLEAAVQQNLALDVRLSHLDGALKECVRQLRQAREEQEQRICEAVAERTHEWESTKSKLEGQLLELQTKAEDVKSGYQTSVDPALLLKLEFLEKENSILKLQLLSRSEELDIRTIERDLSTQAAETASKLQLDSIKKMAKLEAECRRLQAVARKSSSIIDHKSASSLNVWSLTDSQSDTGERLHAVDIDIRKMSTVDRNECEPSCSDSWASALITELAQFKNEKLTPKNFTSCSLEMDIMDDFLEMERLAALPEMQGETCFGESETADLEENNVHTLRTELETMSHRVTELESKLARIEGEKAELENAVKTSQDSLEASKAQLTETRNRLEELQKEQILVNETKEFLELQLNDMKAEARAVSVEVDLLKAEAEKEQKLSAEMAARCEELEDNLMRKTQEVQLQKTASLNSEPKIKQEDFAAAADKLAECQNTIASLGRQLKSLATLEDFLIETTHVPGSSGGRSMIPSGGEEAWKLHSNDTFPKSDPDSSTRPEENSGASVDGCNEESPGSSSSSNSSGVAMSHDGSTRTKNGFGKFFSRSKSGVQLENR